MTILKNKLWLKMATSEDVIDGLVRPEVKDMPENFWYNETEEPRINLQSSENTIRACGGVIKSIVNCLDSINRYTAIGKTGLLEAIARYNQVGQDNIIVGNGSDDIIELVAKTFLGKGDNIVIPSPTFPTYSNAAMLLGASTKFVKLEEDLRLDVKKVLKNIDKNTKAIFIANPNNPTGNILISESDAKVVLDNFRGILVIDECYFEFSGLTLKNLIKKYDRLIIIRSFSKSFSLAGLRIGYAIASKKCIAWMRRVGNTIQPFSVNACGQAAAIAAIRYKDYFMKNFIRTKNVFGQKLCRIKNIDVIPTDTTFLLVKILRSDLTSSRVKNLLAEKGVLIKDCGSFGLGNTYIRMGIPETKDMDYVVNCMREIFGGR